MTHILYDFAVTCVIPVVYRIRDLNKIQIEECINLPSGFQCDCNVGYEGNGIHCKDINECMTGAHNCPGMILNHECHMNHMI